jgi:hypothetical protein
MPGSARGEAEADRQSDLMTCGFLSYITWFGKRWGHLEGGSNDIHGPSSLGWGLDHVSYTMDSRLICTC